MSVSVIIKALNEERHIGRAVASALAALEAAGRGGEVILADAGSSDRTVEIASGYPIRIVQLTRPEDRGCGSGPQLGYQYAAHACVCLIDGDMMLHAGFLAEALALLEADPRLAGVGGLVIERNLQSIEFQRRVRRADPDLRPGPVDRLNGGGLYRRAAIESVGYMSDRNLHGYEEVELALRLRAEGWTLRRLASPFVDHFGHTIGGYGLLVRRFRSGYIYGIGEMLRAALGRPHLRQALRDLPEIRLWLGLQAFWAMVLVLAAAAPSPLLKAAVPLGTLALLFAALCLKNRSFALGLYALVSWHAHALGMALGFLRPRVPPTRWIESRDLGAATGAPSTGARPSLGLTTVASAVMLLASGLLAAWDRPARAEWVPVRDTSLAIRAGSALDFSAMFPTAAAGSRGRVVARPDGHLAFADRPEEPVRFLCASLAWTPASGRYPDHAAADLYAEQLRRHGYNAARFHFVDLNLMFGRTADFDYDPEVLDRFRYLLAALKRNGVYWVVDAMTSPNGALVDETRDLKLGVHIHPADRQLWLRFVRDVLGTPNPYTGTSPLRDPALALVMLANENGLTFDAILNEVRTGERYPPALLPVFDAWLKDTYGTDAALRAAWPDLRPDESLARGNVALPESRDGRGPRMRDLERFFAALQADTAGWMTRELRGLGYAGLVSAYNNGSTTGESLGRSTLPVITADVYHEEVDSLATPLTITGRSSFDDRLGYLRAAMEVRWLDRPFVLTEYDHVFPNPYRHEAGAVVPAYAALQGWDLIDRHAFGAIDLDFDQPWLHKRAILPYDLGLDPVGRASETLAVLLFRRGDVSPARGTVALRFGDPADLAGDGQEALPAAETELGLVSRFGLASHAAALPWDAVVLPSPPSVAATDGALAELHRTGGLGATNATDAAIGRFQSDTGEITLEGLRREARIVTSRTEAVTFAAVPAPVHLDHLTVEAADGPALVALASLDGARIAESRRLLVIVASDAGNTGMEFTDERRLTVVDFGHMPVRIQRRRVTLSLDLAHPADWHLSSLHLNGAPGDVVPVETGAGTLVAHIDNATPRHGPTTFFLLDRRL